MHQSYNLSYSSFSNQGLALGVYTNSMTYKFSNNLNIQLDASFMHSPYNTFGKEYQNSFNGFFISHAALNYKPWKDVSISVQYRNVPNSYYSPYFNGYYYGGGMFDNSFDASNDPFLDR